MEKKIPKLLPRPHLSHTQSSVLGVHKTNNFASPSAEALLKWPPTAHRRMS
jgi:hypothetical protein